MGQEEKDFYAGFETVVDQLTVHVQLNQIQSEMEKQLKTDYGKVIPRQSREQLVERFFDALDNLGY